MALDERIDNVVFAALQFIECNTPRTQLSIISLLVETGVKLVWSQSEWSSISRVPNKML